MASSFETAGAAGEESEWAALSMDRAITGLVTQRSLLRDASVPYVQAKFYGATRYDSIADGLNYELNAKLTGGRRAGSSPWNATAVPAGLGAAFSFKWLLDNVEQVQLFAANATGVYDVTAGGTVSVYAKAAGAGPTRFVGVGNTMYFADGANFKRYFKPSTSWTASISYTPGQMLLSAAGKLQLLVSTSAGTSHSGIWGIAITQAAIVAATLGGATKYFSVYTLATAAPAMTPGYYATPYGQTTYPGMEIVYTAQNIAPAWGMNLGANQIAFYNPGASAPDALVAETGYLVCAMDAAGVSGSALPSFSNSIGGSVQDAQCFWVCIGTPTQNVGIAAPAAAPTLTPGPGCRIWQAQTVTPVNYSILDTNGNVQVCFNGVPFNVTGAAQPSWATALGATTSDNNGALQWINCGQIGTWTPLSAFAAASSIVDRAGNLQYVSAGGSASSGASYPGFATGLGATTTDGGLTWTNVGPGSVLASGTINFAYSYGCADGSVSTASPSIAIGGVLGVPGAFDILIGVQFATDPQVNSIAIWATPQGQSTLIEMDTIPNNDIGGAEAGGSLNFTYHAANADSSYLNAFLSAPIAHSADPPPAALTAPAYHLGRLWGLVGNVARYSNGVNTGTGNGNTQWPPLNADTCQEKCTKLRPTTISQAALLVYGTSNIYVIGGSGTSDSPILPMQVYMPGVGLLGYDEETMVGSTAYLYTPRRKVVTLDPSAGYCEIGQPIGDQFLTLTTGGYAAQHFNPGSCHLVWHERNSGDSAIFICDPAVGWFAYQPTAPPESGFVWSPLAAVPNLSAIASVETTPGGFDLLLSPLAAGPLLKRDTTTNADNGAAFACYVTIGNIVLCATGEIAEVAWVALESIRIGTQPTVGLLFGEIKATLAVPFDVLSATGTDPPNLAESETLFSDRYETLQNGVCPKCKHLQLRIAWAVENEPNELLTHAIYGAKHKERSK